MQSLLKHSTLITILSFVFILSTHKMNAIHIADTYANIKETIKEGNIFKQYCKRNSTLSSENKYR